jgi:predicted nucleic acid-binding protein
VLRPKGDGRTAHFYTIVSRDTVDADFAAHRQRFLAEQGYAYRIVDADDLYALPLERWSLTAVLLSRAFDLADAITSYDALYVALAEVVSVPLVTRDRRLARAAQRWVTVELV